jgi:phosphoribosylanthranilate isomerase
MPKIKICGLSRLVDIDMVNEARPDYIGFVFAKSKRQVTEETASLLKSRLDPAIKAVGVFVNEESDTIIHLCRTGTIDIIQLHGDETEEDIQRLRQAVTNPIIKAVRVRTAEDICGAQQQSCDYLLLDAYREDQYGGSGETFDWSVITQAGKPFFLAGGIHAGNVINAIRLAEPYCIDVSSGVETDGYKDRSKINEIIMKVRSVK